MSAPVPPELLDSVVRRLDPVAVYLFGSHARGEAGPDSDIDLFVVVDDDASLDDIGRIRLDAHRINKGPVDVVVRRRSKFSRLSRHPGGIDEVVAGEGIELYCRERPVAIDGEVGEVEEVIVEWLEKARTDLKLASIAVGDDDLVGNTATLLQQGLEKVLKAELIAKAVRSWKTHNLEELADAAGSDVLARVAEIDLDLVSSWAVEPRYPSEQRPPQIGDVRRLQPLIQAYYDETRARLLPGG